MGLDLERVIHSIKTGLACLVGFALIKALHSYLFFDQWLIVTIMVVMCAQISVGGIYAKSMLRFIGTCAGSLIAALTLTFFGDNNLVLALVIALSGLLFSYIATGRKSYSDAGTLGAVTVAIILINPSPTLALTFERFFEITLGILIATLISQFILPIHARNHLRRSQAQALRLLGDYYAKAVSLEPSQQEKISALDEDIVQSLRTQRLLAKDAKQELLGSKFEPDAFKRLMEGEKHILRSIDFLNRLPRETKLQHLLKNNEKWLAFNERILAIFSTLAQQIERGEPLLEKFSIPRVPPLEEEATRSNSHPKNQEPALALAFCLENITKELKGLAEILAKR